MGTTRNGNQRRDPNSRSLVRIPEETLDARILDLAAPLIARLGSSPSSDAVRKAVELTIT